MKFLMCYMEIFMSGNHLCNLKWPALTKAADFWTILRVQSYIPPWASKLHSLAVRSVSLSLSLCLPPAFVSAGQYTYV
jgi:hypothetical protein